MRLQVGTPVRPSRRQGFKILLAIGFFVCGVAAISARQSPASTFELSIYESTPVRFWIGVALSLTVSIFIAIFARKDVRVVALVLAGTAFTAVVSLPLLRGYFYYGEYDSLTHLAWLKDLTAGALSPFDLFYPGIHELSLLVEFTAGFPKPRALLFVVFLFPLVFVLFTSLTAYELTGSPFAAVLGFFAGMMLLPVNQIATHYMAPHPFSETVLYSSLTLYLLVLYMKRGATSRFGRVPFALLFAASSVGMVLMHPMEASVFVVVLVTIALVQTLYRWFQTEFPPTETSHGVVYPLAIFHTVVFLIWTAQKPKFTGTFERVVQAIGTAVTGTGGSAAAGGVIRHQSSSLTAIGSSLEDLFLRLFLVSALFAVSAGAVMLLSLSGRLDERFPETKYVAASLIVLGPFSLLFIFGDVSKFFFRVQGSLMVFVTLLGVVGFHLAVRRGRRHVSRRGVRFAVCVVLCLMLVHSMAVVYTSPYIFKSNRQVTEAEFTGHEAAFEYQGEEINFAGIRTGPNRYLEAVYGRAGVPPSKDILYHAYADKAVVPGENLSDIRGYFGDDHYLIVTTRDVEREVEAYRELRYSEDQLDAVHTQTNVHRVQSNGALRLYLFDPRLAGESTP